MRLFLTASLSFLLCAAQGVARAQTEFGQIFQKSRTPLAPAVDPAPSSDKCHYPVSNNKLEPRAELLVPPPTNPAEVASSDSATRGITFSTATADSFKKEVSAKASISLITHCDAPTWTHDPNGKHFIHAFESTYGRYLVDISATYDDQWKDGPPAVSTVTQNYSAILISLSKFAYIPTTLLASEYINNQQGVVLEQEYGAGTYIRFASKPTNAKGSPSKTIKRVFLASFSVREAIDKLSGQNDEYNLGAGTYMQFSTALNAKATVAGTFKGFVPFQHPLVNGRASADIKYIFNLTSNKAWAFTAEITNTYFATVPNKYRDNSFTSSLGIKYSPPTAK